MISIRSYSNLNSAWLKKANNFINIENVFINNDVQKLLKSLTGINIKEKIFAHRKIESPQRSHYALMNDDMFNEILKKMKKCGEHFLQFVPVKEPRLKTYQVLSKDDEISNFDTAKFVFTDITFDSTDKDRIIVVREPNGNLRTALPEEHDRMNRIYNDLPDRPINEPKLFTQPHLKNALEKNMDEFVLDWMCFFYEPDDPRYVELCCFIFDQVVENKKFDLLYSTRHFGPFLFYLMINENTSELYQFFLKQSKENSTTSNQILADFDKLKITIDILLNEKLKQ